MWEKFPLVLGYEHSIRYTHYCALKCRWGQCAGSGSLAYLGVRSILYLFQQSVDVLNQFKWFYRYVDEVKALLVTLLVLQSL
jgi:hypothetical protein